MNCHDLEGMVDDLARGRMMDASLREKALSHAASCACCAMRLADERALATGLRSVAEATDGEAPSRVEAALLAAFREQRAALPAPATSGTRTARQRWLYAAAGVAAVAVIVMVFALTASKTQNSTQRTPEEADGGGAPGPAAPKEMRPPGTQPSASPAGPAQTAASVQAPERRRRPTDRMRNAGQSKRPADDLDKSGGETEIATDFIPLMNRETLAQLDGGQVVRVELPRSALMSFGLPMDMERAAERIKADVVVGNDGLARAIRFVR